jgi:hypothetical protein
MNASSSEVDAALPVVCKNVNRPNSISIVFALEHLPMLQGPVARLIDTLVGCTAT